MTVPSTPPRPPASPKFQLPPTTVSPQATRLDRVLDLVTSHEATIAENELRASIDQTGGRGGGCGARATRRGPPRARRDRRLAASRARGREGGGPARRAPSRPGRRTRRPPRRGSRSRGRGAAPTPTPRSRRPKPDSRRCSKTSSTGSRRPSTPCAPTRWRRAATTPPSMRSRRCGIRVAAAESAARALESAHGRGDHERHAGRDGADEASHGEARGLLQRARGGGGEAARGGGGSVDGFFVWFFERTRGDRSDQTGELARLLEENASLREQLARASSSSRPGPHRAVEEAALASIPNGSFDSLDGDGRRGEADAEHPGRPRLRERMLTEDDALVLHGTSVIICIRRPSRFVYDDRPKTFPRIVASLDLGDIRLQLGSLARSSTGVLPASDLASTSRPRSATRARRSRTPPGGHVQRRLAVAVPRVRRVRLPRRSPPRREAIFPPFFRIPPRTRRAAGSPRPRPSPSRSRPRPTPSASHAPRVPVQRREVQRGVAVVTRRVYAHRERRERHREDVLVARLGSLQDPPEHAALRRVDPRVRGVVLILQRHELDLLRGWDRRGGWMRGGRRMTTVDVGNARKVAAVVGTRVACSGLRGGMSGAPRRPRRRAHRRDLWRRSWPGGGIDRCRVDCGGHAWTRR